MSERRPLLMCDQCRKLRLHRLDHVDEGPYDWREWWRCIRCGTGRWWGTSDPLKLHRASGIPSFDQRVNYDSKAGEPL